MKQLKQSKGKNGKAGKAVKSLATLTEDERQSVLSAKHLLDAKELERRLMERGLASLHQAIRAKYKLPEKFDIDLATGEVRPHA